MLLPLALALPLGCSGRALEPLGTGGTTAVAGSGGQASGLLTGSGGSGGGIILGNPPATGGTAVGYGGEGGAGPVVLPTFDCSDPMFFPLRVDADGQPLEGLGGTSGEEPEVPAEPGEVGSGDLTVLLVFDKSGSMASHWGGKSRWQAGSDAVLLGLDGILDVVTMGALFFPFPEEGAVDGCGVPAITVSPQIDFRSGRGFKESWIAGACEAAPDGATPLEHALEVADQALVTAQGRGLLDQRARVVLVTDGEPTCQDDTAQIVSYPTKWSEQGIDTHVIGLPGASGAADLLDAIAQAGGTGMHVAPAQLGQFEEQVYDLLR